MSFRITNQLWDKIVHFASFPQTPGMSTFSISHVRVADTHNYAAVSLQQMVLFGQNPSQGTLLKASEFLSGVHCYLYSVDSG
jgi:pyruvate dehydrogenase kinase 2/3/4